MKEGGREGRKGGKAGPRKLQNVFFSMIVTSLLLLK